ncbi:MAG: hypothetical protein WCI27_07865 [Candidatus Omnitrophota bacterium]
MSACAELRKHLKPGQVYRRADLEAWSTAVDRHLKELVDEGVLEKMSQGLYYHSAKVSFGNIPPEDEKLVSAFLRSADFLITSPNLYNSLGVGTTQMYNACIVYNHKRHGRFELGGKVFDFRLKHKFPQKVSEEFLLIDLLNNLNQLAEDRKSVLNNVKARVLGRLEAGLKRVINTYAGERTKKLLNEWISEESLAHA